MDVLNTLKLHMGHIVKCVYSMIGTDEEFLDEMYLMIKYDIGINFDSENFYLMEYDKANNIGFKIKDPFAPRGLLVMIRDLVKHSRMKENIKNKRYLIHFREFKDEVYLEDKENTLRVEAFLTLHQYFKNPTVVRIFLINKLVDIRNEIRKEKIDENLISLKILRYRIEVILRAIEKNTLLEY